MNSIVFLNGSMAGMSFQIPDIPVVIGRSPEAHICVQDPWISGMHAMLERRGDSIWIVDLGSRNGTYVGYESVKEAPITSNCLVRLGRTIFRHMDMTADPPPQRLSHQPFNPNATLRLSLDRESGDTDPAFTPVIPLSDG